MRRKLEDARLGRFSNPGGKLIVADFATGHESQYAFDIGIKPVRVGRHDMCLNIRVGFAARFEAFIKAKRGDFVDRTHPQPVARHPINIDLKAVTWRRRFGQLP